MFCGLKFVQGHRCIKSQLYQILVEDIDDLDREPEKFQDCVETIKYMGQDDIGNRLLYICMSFWTLKVVKL